MSSLTVSAEAAETVIYGYTVSDMQTGVTVTADKITGTVKKLTDGQLAEYWGPGNFLALKLSELPDNVLSCKVGLTPSEGSGLVEIKGDPDMNLAAKITDKNTQKFTVQMTTIAGTKTRYWDLSGLTLED